MATTRPVPTFFLGILGAVVPAMAAPGRDAAAGDEATREGVIAKIARAAWDVYARPGRPATSPANGA